MTRGRPAANRGSSAWGRSSGSRASKGGPAPTTRSSEYVAGIAVDVAGIAVDAVKRVDVIRSDGASSPARLSEDNAFFFELDPADLARGIYLDHLEARGPSGRLVKRIEMNDGS